MKMLPKVLILFRLLLAPVIVSLALTLQERGAAWIVILLYAGLFSDILDGIIARRLGVQDATLRRMDSQVDMIFWVASGFAAWLLYPEVIREHRLAIIVIFSMEAACYLVSLLKFRRETCAHAFLSKVWGLSLLIAFTSLIGFQHAGLPFTIAVVLGLLSHIDRILITVILPRWTHDIPSAYHAYLIRKGVGFRKNKWLN